MAERGEGGYMLVLFCPGRRSFASSTSDDDDAGGSLVAYSWPFDRHAMTAIVHWYPRDVRCRTVASSDVLVIPNAEEVGVVDGHHRVGPISKRCAEHSGHQERRRRLLVSLLRILADGKKSAVLQPTALTQAKRHHYTYRQTREYRHRL